MPDITKPDANPIVAAVLCLVVPGLGHMIPNGQQRKFIYTLIWWALGFLTCGILSMVVAICNIIDAYQTAERLKKGETIGENEYTFEFAFKIAKILDKTATFKGTGAPAA